MLTMTTSVKSWVFKGISEGTNSRRVGEIDSQLNHSRSYASHYFKTLPDNWRSP